MKNIRIRVFGKKMDDKLRVWGSLSKRTEEGELVSCNLDLVLSKIAREKFKSIAKETRNPEIRMAYVSVTDGWLTVIPYEEPAPALFINDLEIAIDRTEQAPTW